MGLDTGHSPCERVSVGHRTVYVGHPHELASPHACLSVISKAENVYLLPFHEFPGTIGKRTSRRPVAPRRPPLMNSPFVPSVARCESAEGEQKRQVAAARCVIQAANVALYLRDAVLRRTSYGQNRAMRRPSIAPRRNSTKRDATQACSSHVSTQGFCTRWWRPLWAFQRPCSRSRPWIGQPGRTKDRTKDEPGLICVEELLYAQDGGGNADRPCNFDPVAYP